MSNALRITEIFLSIQGESRSIGWPTVFVRLTGCPLRCRYCDTTYAFQGGVSLTLDAVLEQVKSYGVRHVCVTGGEPLAQRQCLALLNQLCDAGYYVSLETSGAIDVSGVDARVERVLDLKTPESGEADRNRIENFAFLTPSDQVKVVICSRDDFDWACAQVREHRLWDKCEVIFSPAFGMVEPRALAEWILEARLPVRFQVQLHKILWDEAQGR